MHVLFACPHDAGRSKISQAMLARAADGRHEQVDRGTPPPGR